MKNVETLNSNCLVEEFGDEVKELRRECNHYAAKSITRFTILLTLLFMLAVVQFMWING